MGTRKRLVAEARKEAKKTVWGVKAVGVPTSPRKMRLLADVIREKDVMDAFSILYHLRLP